MIDQDRRRDSFFAVISCASLGGRKRRGRREIKISSGSETGDFEGMLRIEVDQEDSYLCRWRRGTYCIRLMCTRILIISLFTGPIRGECDTHSSYDRLGMNRKRPTAYVWQWGVVFREETDSIGLPPASRFTPPADGCQDCRRRLLSAVGAAPACPASWDPSAYAVLAFTVGWPVSRARFCSCGRRVGRRGPCHPRWWR